MNEGQVPRILWAPDIEEFENDCACATANLLPLTGGEVTAPLWEKSPALYQEPLSDEETLVFNPLASVGVVVLNQPAMAILEAHRVAQALEGDTAQQLAALGLLQPQGAVQGPPQVEAEVLTAWLHVTNECNLRCTYCYVHKTDEAMDEATGRSAIEATFRAAVKHHFKVVKLKYAGGEATLNFKLIRILHQYAQALADQTGLGLKEVILSNGVALSNDQLDFIRGSGMNLMISLDGIGAEHDAQRSFANGRGSFKLVAWGINRAVSRGVKPHLSITVTGQSVDGLAKAVTFALERDLPFNLNFYRDNDHAKNREALQAEDQRLITAMQAAFAVIEEKLPRRSLVSSLVDRANFGGSHTHTCGAGHNYLVVDHKGRIARCQMEIERTVTDVFAADPLLTLQNVPQGFQNVAVDEKEGCRSCHWRYWCTGGCPLLTYRVTGRSDVKSPYCQVYKSLYPAVLRLEGLRLLKWHTAPVQLH
jgi:uncharacterized protein